MDDGTFEMNPLAEGLGTGSLVLAGYRGTLDQSFLELVLTYMGIYILDFF